RFPPPLLRPPAGRPRPGLGTAAVNSAGPRRRVDGVPAQRLLAADGQQPRVPPPQRPLERRQRALEDVGRPAAPGRRVNSQRATTRLSTEHGTRTLMSHKDGFWQDRRVFVTGCTGLVGAWTVRAFL